MRRFVSNWTRSVRHHSPRTFGVMRATIRHGLRIVLAATILVAGVVYLGRHALRVRYHLWALRGDEQRILAPVKSPVTFVGKLSALLSEVLRTRRSWEDWLKDRDHHEEALVRLGYLSRQEFSFTNRTLNAMRLMTNAQSRFSTRMTSLCVLTNGQFLSATSVCTNSVVRVIAPKNEAEKWRTLISESDQNTR